MNKKLLLSVAVVLLSVFVVAVGVVYAQEGTPPAQGTNPPPAAGSAVPAAKAKAQALARFGIPGMGWKAFDAAANALKLTPTQAFERLHSGETLPQIAQAQGVDLQTLQQAVKSARQDAATQAIGKAVQSGRITQDRGDWLLQGLKNGWLGSALKNFLGARLR
jgi:hypothetical protein